MLNDNSLGSQVRQGQGQTSVTSPCYEAAIALSGGRISPAKFALVERRRIGIFAHES